MKYIQDLIVRNVKYKDFWTKINISDAPMGTKGKKLPKMTKFEDI